MAAPLSTVSPRLRRAAAALGVAVAVVLLLLSHEFGRAKPTDNYRPAITTDAIKSGCFPLPGNAQLDGLAYQVRSDEDVDPAGHERRVLKGQYDLVDRDEAERLLIKAFTDVGFRRPASGEDDAGAITLTKGSQQVAIVVAELPRTSAETLVRGTFELDLPVTRNARPDDPICHSETSTKRWKDPTQKDPRHQ